MAKVQPKNRAENEFRAQAEALRTKLADPTVQMTKDELEQTVANVATLEARAAAVAGFTPEQEIEDQGGDEPLRRAAPDSGDKDTEEVKSEMDQLAADVKRSFGSVNNYIRAVTQRSVYERCNAKQRAVLKRASGLTVNTLGRDDLEQRATIVGTASDASGGEFLLPLQQAPNIFSVENVQVGLLQRGQRYPVTGRSIRIPYVVQTDGDNTRPMAGVAAITIVGEGGTKPAREPVFLQRTLNVQKWAAIAKAGDELFADDYTGDFESVLTRQVGGQVLNEINGYMVTGTGSGQPLGALHANNTALLTVNRQTSMSVTATDAFKMWSRHTHGPSSYWSCSRRVMEQLFGLTLGSNTLVTFLQNLNGAPVFSLLGYPVVVSDLQPTLGVKGDLALINPAFYAVAMRTQLTIESSIHVEFVNDLTTYRFYARAGGLPIPDGTYAYAASGGTKIDEHSPFVVLGDDATS